MNKDVMQIITLLTPVLLIAGVAIGGYYWRKLGSREKLIYLFLTASLLIDLLSRYWGLISTAQNNLFFLSASTIIEFGFIGWIYLNHELIEKRNWLKWIYMLVCILLIINLTQQSFIISPEKFQLYNRLLSNVLLLILCLLCIRDTLLTDEPKQLRKHYCNSVLIIYLIVDLFVVITLKFMITASPTVVVYFWLFRLFFLLLLYFNFSYDLWLHGRRNKYKLSV